MGRFWLRALSSLTLLTFAAAPALADTVNATDVIYAAGTQAAVAAPAGGTTPFAVAVSPGTSYFTFTASGMITLNGGTLNDADGVGAAVSNSYNTGSGSISGITAPDAGYLVGVFVAAGGPSGAAPASLDFTTGSGTGFTTLNPLIDQVFFIGDGRTGDGTGSIQDFYVPTGAGTLYLGISDAGGYGGSPSSYSDNSGSFTVTETQVGGAVPPPVGATPEPSSLLLLGTGMLTVIGSMRKRLV